VAHARGAEVVVVGAGIVGCAVAYELARRGASVQVVDDRPVGMGATQASAGILAPYIEAGGNRAFLDLTVRSLELYEDLIARVAADGGGAVPYQRSGTLEVATSDERMAALREAAARLEGRGVPMALLDASAAHAEEPGLGGDIAGGLLIPVHGFVAAADLARALIAAARRRGAQLVEGSRVRRITRRQKELLVETERGSLTGNAVVVAAGCWSGEIDLHNSPARAPVRPVRGQLLRLAWSGAPLRRVIWSERCYLVPWADGTLLVGATTEEAGFDERATAAGVRDLLDAACDLVPHVWTAGFLGARVGLRPATSDELPIIGFSHVMPNLMYATGHYRNGVLLAPITAQLVADAMLEDRVDPVLEAMSPRRFGL
jgi:glycine oxidase